MVSKNNAVLVFALIVLALLSVVAFGKWHQKNTGQLPILSVASLPPTLSLTDQHGRPFSAHTVQGKLTVAHFFFTHCPVVCPKMIRNLQAVQQAIENETNVLFCSFSVDPERDSVRQLEAYARRMNITGNWLLLTGNKKVIYALARKNLKATVSEGDGGPQDFLHSELLVLLDGDSRIRGYYRGTDPKETASLIRDAKKLIDASDENHKDAEPK